MESSSRKRFKRPVLRHIAQINTVAAYLHLRVWQRLPLHCRTEHAARRASQADNTHALHDAIEEAKGAASDAADQSAQTMAFCSRQRDATLYRFLVLAMLGTSVPCSQGEHYDAVQHELHMQNKRCTCHLVSSTLRCARHMKCPVSTS